MPQRSVLFVCLGNAIRSQMAEAFARAYGGDVISPESAGLFPAPGIAPLTHKVLMERSVTLDGQFPKSFDELDASRFDLIVNMSGYQIEETIPLREWRVVDPIGQSEEVYRRVAAQIETLVMQLILEFRGIGRPVFDTQPQRPSK